MLRKMMIVAFAAVLGGLVSPHAATAADHYAFEYGAGWGDGVVYGPGRYVTPHHYPYEGYPYIGYDGPPFFLDWAPDCYVMHRPAHRGWPSRTVQICE
jgi:hypothetical protein